MYSFYTNKLKVLLNVKEGAVYQKNLKMYLWNNSDNC